MKKTNTKETNEIIEIPAEEAPYALPDGWKWVRIKDAFDVTSSKRVLKDDWTSCGIPFYRTREIVKLSENGFVNNDLFISKDLYYALKEKYGIPSKGDLLISGVGTIGIPYVVDNDKEFYFKDGNVIWFKNKGLFNPKFVFYLYKTNFMFNQIHDMTSGTTVDTYTIINAMNTIVPLPPLETQKRIVDRIESLFAKLDEAKEKAQTALDGFELRKSAILHKAFTGQLTAKWRSSCRPSDISSAPAHIESAPADISSSAPAEHIDSDASITAEHFVNISSVPNSLSPKQVCCELAEQALPNSSLPNGWLKKCFADVANIKLNLVEPSDYPNFPHIAPDSIEKKTGVLLTYRTVAEDKVTSAKHRFYPGQILYSKIRPYLSKVVIIDFDGLCSADMYPIEAVENTRFLWYYMLSNEFLNQASNAGSRTVLPKINQKELAKISVSLPPLLEQQEIVRILDDLLAKENAAKEAAEAVIEKIDLMKKSILARAFRGEL